MRNYSEFCPYVFLDVDGVMTELEGEVGSYITHRGSKYGISEKPYSRLVKLLSETGAKVVISSNWRRFEEAGPNSMWHHASYGDVSNPLPALKAMLKGSWLCDLPSARHITKSQALRMWFEQNLLDPAKCRYVVFDDDVSEGFHESEFKDHFILTDFKTGLSDSDCKKAKEILKA